MNGWPESQLEILPTNMSTTLLTLGPWQVDGQSDLILFSHSSPPFPAGNYVIRISDPNNPALFVNTPITVQGLPAPVLLLPPFLGLPVKLFQGIHPHVALTPSQRYLWSSPKGVFNFSICEESIAALDLCISPHDVFP